MAPGFMWCFLSTSPFSPAEQSGLSYYMTRFQGGKWTLPGLSRLCLRLRKHHFHCSQSMGVNKSKVQFGLKGKEMESTSWWENRQASTGREVVGSLLYRNNLKQTCTPVHKYSLIIGLHDPGILTMWQSVDKTCTFHRQVDSKVRRKEGTALRTPNSFLQTHQSEVSSFSGVGMSKRVERRPKCLSNRAPSIWKHEGIHGLL